MDKFLVKKYTHNFWQVAEVFKNGIKIATVNKFYDITPDWITIYDTIGGSGTGWRKGDVINKIFIGNAELTVEHHTNRVV